MSVWLRACAIGVRGAGVGVWECGSVQRVGDVMTARGCGRRRKRAEGLRGVWGGSWGSWSGWRPKCLQRWNTYRRQVLELFHVRVERSGALVQLRIGARADGPGHGQHEAQ